MTYVHTSIQNICNLAYINFMSSHSDLLQMPIASLPLSSALKKLIASKGYPNLDFLLKQKISHLRTLDGLTFEDELELYELIKEAGLENLWREE